MKDFMIGKTVQDNNMFIGTPENGHINLCGKSGVGKSTAMLKLLMEAIKNGYLAVILNWRNSFSEKVLNSEMRTVYEKQRRLISAADDGISIPLFTPFYSGVGKEEPRSLMINRISNMLSQSANLSDAQKRKVREAVDTIVELNAYSEYGIKALEELLQSEGSSADKAIDKLSPFLTTNLLRDGNFFCSKDQIIEIDLNDFELYDQKVIVEFLLSWLFQYGQKGGFRERGLVIYIDEAQNLSYKPDSPMYLLLNESRKHNIRVFMAAPSFTAGGKRGMNIATMCGTSLFFKPLPSDLEKTARIIDPDNKTSCVQCLSDLKIGECLATGSFVINDETINKPTKLIEVGT